MLHESQEPPPHRPSKQQSLVRSIHGSTNSRIVEHRYGDPSSLTTTTTSTNNISNHGPLTILARHRVTPGKESLYRQWMTEMDSLQRTKFQGYLGCEIVQPTCGDHDKEFVSIFRYQNYDMLQTWMDSDDRSRMLDQTMEFEDEPIQTLYYYSLEYFFGTLSPPPIAAGTQELGLSPRNAVPPSPPPRYKMVIVTTLVIWLQVLFLTPYTVGLIPNLPFWASSGLSTFLIVVLTVYFLMPLTTKYLLHWWLFPSSLNKSCVKSSSFFSPCPWGRRADPKVNKLKSMESTMSATTTTHAHPREHNDTVANASAQLPLQNVQDNDHNHGVHASTIETASKGASQELFELQDKV